PGGGVNPLRGQNTVQGACDMGGLPNVFPRYQKVADEKSRSKFAEAWSLSGPSDFALPTSTGLTITEMTEAAGNGSIRGLYILGENPVLTDPDTNHVRSCLDRAEFVVLQEIFPSETSEYCDVLLPGTTFAERNGTFTNTERRVQLFRQAIPHHAISRPDWSITQELATSILERTHREPAGPQAGWDFNSPADIMDEIATLTPSYAGVSHSRLDDGERLQWPVLDANHPGTPILHVNEFARGKGLFHPVDHLEPNELPDDEFPLLLTTGRVLYHWHGGEMTRRSEGLNEVCPESFIEISAIDARVCGIEENAELTVTSRRGTMHARAAITDRVTPGLLFGNFHFPGSHNVNILTNPALDPAAKIPEYKVCAVRIAALT
ncbi:MAG: molybdopterin oxidoreductase family protein, partial [Planctomycetaceae bacterium]